MNLSSPAIEALRRPRTLIAIGVAAVLVIVWLVAFFLPQGKKLSSLQSEQRSLQLAVIQDDAKVRQLRDESHHTKQIQALYSALQGYVPATADLYTYIQTLSGAGKAAGVSITSIDPSTVVAMTGSQYSVLPINTTVKGTYDQLLSFIHAVYALPRLTDINTVSISGGGSGSNRSTVLSASFALAIFTTQKPATP